MPALAPARRERASLWLACAWALVVLAIALHQWRFWQHEPLDTDVMALLPRDAAAQAADQVAAKLAASAARRIVVLVGAADQASAARAAEAFDTAWRAAAPELLSVPAAATDPAAAIAALAPWRDRLLSDSQRATLQAQGPAQLAEQALAALYQPGLAPRLGAWSDDPLNLGADWWRERAAASPVQPRDGHLWLATPKMQWQVLLRDLPGSAFSLDGSARQRGALDAAEAVVRAAVPQARVLAAGVPLFAEAAAAQASREINVIGWGSLAAIVLLMWLAFRSPLPVIGVAVSLAVGCAAALSVTALVFDRVHLITLVFGATLIGVAEDYGIHYWAARANAPREAPPTLIRRLLPGMLLALLSSIAAYAALGVAPFPGLRQMALFSSVGLAAAFLTVLCWFPLADRRAPRETRFARTLGASLRHWPRLRLPASRRGRWLATASTGLAVVLLAIGIARLHVDDDIRQLQSVPKALLQSQREVQQLLRAPSPAQFIVVRGESADAVLAREESIRPLLAARQAAGELVGWSALSDWVPSSARQRDHAAWVAAAEQAALASAAELLGEAPARHAPRASEALPLPSFLALPLAEPLRAQWLGAVAGGGVASVIHLQAPTTAGVQALAAALAGQEGIELIDRPAQVSATLGSYRSAMSALLVAGFVLVYLVLARRFGRRAWRAWLPTLLATGFTLATLGWLGEPFQLFNVLALIVLLGVGVDYGIFLVEHPEDASAWLSVMLGAASTLLSFGLLGLSSTPALRAFGLTLALGIATVWALSPLLRPAIPSSPEPAPC
ncbi:MMPL family transporter [Rivibacter subsaxonicus]|uniref:Putative exporter n=1 Tax=Rivibacter subsaxonicus TaxID=457575 RepID=A0A4Q7W1B0_9BURK|nr:hypothetical protein [Rivibacter subsaxonicus]RZU03011.1 putative exporter [Rivibacter subsaxonicus]